MERIAFFSPQTLPKHVAVEGDAEARRIRHLQPAVSGLRRGDDDLALNLFARTITLPWTSALATCPNSP